MKTIPTKENLQKLITVAFVDRHSRGSQHLSGNTSLMISFVLSLRNSYQFTPIYFCHESSEREARQWIGKTILHKDILISSSKKILDRHPTLYVYIYPQYKYFPIYLARFLCGIPQIAVSHGHFNSFHVEQSLRSIALKTIKLNFFKFFMNVIVYSDYIAKKCRTSLPELITKKTLVVTEIIHVPYFISMRRS
jgi:hypothetical protein